MNYTEHDYEPSTGRQSAMQTDPQCEVCGFPERSSIHS